MEERARNEKERCVYRSRTGRRCRNKTMDFWNVCRPHADFDGAYLKAQEIVSNQERLDTAEGVHAFLTRIARAAAAQQISPRMAGTLTYIAQTMLSSVHRLREEREKVFVVSEKEAWRMKALEETYHDKYHCDPPEEDDDEEDSDEDDSGEDGENSDRLAAAKAKAKGNHK